MPPANDNAAAAAVLSGTSGSVTFDNTGATRQSGEPANGGDSALGTVWFKHTPTTTGDVRFSTQDTPLPAWDTWLEVFTCTDPTDFTTFTSIGHDDDGAPQPGSTDPYGTSAVAVAVTAGTDYYVQVAWYDDVSGPPERSDLRLSWAPYTPPPPAPTASGWVDITATRDTRTMWAGDDIEVTGTDLDTITTATIGGVPQTFTITDSTHLTIHVTAAAVNGAVVVSNISGSATAPGDGFYTAIVLYPGPWTYPPDQTASDRSNVTTQASSYGPATPVVSATQPDPAGSPFQAAGGSVGFSAQGGGDGSGSTDVSWSFDGVVIVLDERDGTFTMPNYVPTAEMAADPHAVTYDTATGDTPAPTSDLTISFYEQTGGTLGKAEGSDYQDSNSRTLSEDLWQSRMEYRRLAGTDWAFDGLLPKLVSGAWPAASSLAALPLDFDRAALNPGATLTLSSAGTWTDNRADLVDGAALGPQGPLTVTWADFGTARAWALALSPYIDDTPIVAPTIDASAILQTGSEKSLNVVAGVQGVWQYRPRRYRLIYDTPPVAAAVQTLRRRQQAAPVGSAPRRRQIANRAGSLRRGPGAAP